jgi:hypothetical protein
MAPARSVGLHRKLWEPKEIRLETWYHTRIGPLDAWIKRSQADWYLTHERQRDREKVQPRPVPLHPAQSSARVERLTWTRWVAGEEGNRVQFLPVLPDRSVVIRPRYPLNVPRGKDVLFFVNIPIWVRILVGLPETVMLCELPTVVLSNTWFGDPITGELCYSLKTRAMRDLKAVENHAYMATCPVLIRNQAPSDLDFQRICIRVEHLSVYQGETRLWTNRVEVLFRGEELTGQITFNRNVPGFDEAAVPLCPAREPVEKSLLKRSFFFLKSLTGF